MKINSEYENLSGLLFNIFKPKSLKESINKENKQKWKKQI